METKVKGLIKKVSLFNTERGTWKLEFGAMLFVVSPLEDHVLIARDN